MGPEYLILRCIQDTLYVLKKKKKTKSLPACCRLCLFSIFMPLLLRKPSAPPQLDPLANLLPRHAIRDQLHRQSQPLRLPIPRLVIEKQHILKPDPRPLLQGLKVLDFAPRVYLQSTVKHIDRNLLPPRRLLVIAVILCKRRRRWDVDSLEQFAG